MPVDGLHCDQVDNALEGFLSTDRNLDGSGICSEHFLELTNNLEEVGTRAVHLVDITDTGYIVLVGLTPYGFRLRLNTAYSAESGNGTVKHAERTLYLDSEVNVSRSVNEVDFVLVTVILPECGSGG